MTDVIVVGGGVGGLVAARHIARHGMRVLVLEASDGLGGKVAAHEVAGIELDAGAESFATRGDTVAKLARELGLEVVSPDPVGAWLRSPDGRSFPMPKTGVLGIPSVPMARDVIEVIGVTGALRAQLDSLMSAGPASKERMLGPLVRRRMGRRVLDRLVAPVTLGVHSKHPDELEVDVVSPGLRRALAQEGSLAQAVDQLRSAAPAGSAVQGIPGGIRELVRALERELRRFGADVRTGIRVAEADAAGVTLQNGDRLAADAVVLAAPLADDRPVSIVLATLVVDSPALDAGPRGTGMLVARGAPGIRAKALTHATIKWPWLAEALPPHRHVLRLSYENAPDDLEGVARADASALLGVELPPPVGFDRVDWRAPAARTSAPAGMYLVGEAAAGVGLAAVVAQARTEAERLLEALGTFG